MSPHIQEFFSSRKETNLSQSNMRKVGVSSLNHWGIGSWTNWHTSQTEYYLKLFINLFENDKVQGKDCIFMHCISHYLIVIKLDDDIYVNVWINIHLVTRSMFPQLSFCGGWFSQISCANYILLDGWKSNTSSKEHNYFTSISSADIPNEIESFIHRSENPFTGTGV